MATSIKRSKGSQSSLRIGTFSYWIKIATPHSTSGGFQVYSNTVENDNNRGYWQYTSDGKWRMVDNDASGTHIQLRTNRLFRDHNAWYHFVVRIDTTQSTSTDRVRLYVNGVQETSFDQTDYPAQNTDLKIFEGGQTDREYMNRIYGGSPQSANWYVSHFHYADGQSYGPDTFGSTDATTGEWKINTSPTVTYGNQGWFMFKDDASLNDDSGNSNNWSADSGTIQKSEDCPSNVFATYNAIQNLNDNNALSNGNTTQKETSTVGQRQAICNIGGFTGKYYAEFKMINLGPQNGSSPYCGALSMSNYDNDTYLGNNGIAMHPGGNIYRSANVIDNQTSITYTTNSIVSVALDITNNKCHFRVNGGTWLASGDPANNTGGYDISSLNTGDGMTFASSVFNNNCQWSVNFGNGYFGTTAVSSAGTNASNNGIFEYDVPTGFTALSTKGLNL